MLHHEESLEKYQYNMKKPPFLDNPHLSCCLTLPFPTKIFSNPLICINFGKVTPPPYEGRVRTMT